MNSKERGVMTPRRAILKSSGLLVLGAAAGRIGTAIAAEPKVEPAAQATPPLPWKWVELDPLEAGRRGYKAYLEQGG